MSERSRGHVVGLEPWLPWPLRCSAWWTRPVRAECLAVLRIGMAGCLLVDILTSYRPWLPAFFGAEGLGGSHLFSFYGEAPRLNWSLLRGPGDPLLGMISLALWAALSVWLALWLWEKRVRTTEPSANSSQLARFSGRGFDLAFLWLIAGACVLLGAYARYFADDANAPVVLGPWQDEPLLLAIQFWTWAAAAAMLLLGLWTRLAAVLTWALTISFANANPHIDNAGDAIRSITLFYLMLCPCGAVWSIDWLWRRSRRGDGNVAPAYVWPWALRLLFIQMCLVYFMNGLYKLAGMNWPSGDSLYYVLGDITLTRFSMSQLPLPFPVLRLMTWLVLAWELSFPALMLFRRTRGPALIFGAVFHLGILATMELGMFVPYILCLYLPLLPWDRWLGEKS